MTTETKDRLAAIATYIEEYRGFGPTMGELRFTTYYGLVGTAANLKTHRVSVRVWETSGSVEVESACGTTTRYNATAHTSVTADDGTSTITCKRCAK